MSRTSTDRQISIADLKFLLHDWLGAGELLTRERFADHSVETFDEILELARDIAANEVAPLNRLSDLFPLTLVDGVVEHPAEVHKALRTIIDAGIPMAAVDREYDGMQLPYVLATACYALFQAADPAIWAYAMLSLANANLLAAHGSAEQIERYARRLYAGEYHGTMCLSEPEVGSSLADITTRAERQDDGSYRLFGRKMWISGAEHDLSDNIVHLVLARSPGGPAGVKGLSLFLVPKLLDGPDAPDQVRNDIHVVGLNHKMGYRGITNTVLSIGDGMSEPGGAPGAVGYLIGTENRGLSYMFHMMNEARISVGTGAVALGYTGYLKSLAYARERLQGRLPSDKSAPRPVPIIEHPDVRRMLLAQKSYVEGGLGLVLYAAKLVDEAATAATPELRSAAAAELDLLTPIVKSWPSQWCLQANSLAIQVLGGAGYTQDHDLEQHYRDNRLNPIHEGTHGIHGLDLLGRKVPMDGGAAFDALLAKMDATAQQAVTDGVAPVLGRRLGAVVEQLRRTTRILAECPDRDLRLANSTVYLEAAGHVVVAWLMLGQYLATGTRDDDFAVGKRRAVEYFFRYELPAVGPQLDLLASLDDLTLTTGPQLF
jgi:alkylation response protein AidB-like acyl-CoA dehydrogenase